MKFVNADHSLSVRRPRAGQPFSTNVPRLTYLLPGYPQWTGGRKLRGALLGGAYVISALVLLVFWGHPATWLCLIASVVVQALSWVEAVRQNPFSGMTPTPVLAVTGGGLSLALHAPAFALLSLLAWPSYGPDPTNGSYLVNRLAYKDRLPEPGQWVWLDGSVTGIQSAARVVAVEGQSVEWTGKRWLVDGKEIEIDSSQALAAYPRKFSFLVPGNHVLIDPETRARPGEDRAPLIAVEIDHIAGRVWAKCSPLWERGLL